MYELMCEVPCFVPSLFALLLESTDGMIAGLAGKLVVYLPCLDFFLNCCVRSPVDEIRLVHITCTLLCSTFILT